MREYDSIDKMGLLRKIKGVIMESFAKDILGNFLKNNIIYLIYFTVSFTFYTLVFGVFRGNIAGLLRLDIYAIKNLFQQNDFCIYFIIILSFLSSIVVVKDNFPHKDYPKWWYLLLGILVSISIWSYGIWCGLIIPIGSATLGLYVCFYVEHRKYIENCKMRAKKHQKEFKIERLSTPISIFTLLKESMQVYNFNPRKRLLSDVWNYANEELTKQKESRYNYNNLHKGIKGQINDENISYNGTLYISKYIWIIPIYLYIIPIFIVLFLGVFSAIIGLFRSIQNYNK